MRAAVVKARLVDLDALVAGRVVHLHTGGRFLTRGLVVDDDFAGEQLGHARGVVLHDELLELDRKRQVLQQHTVGLAQDGRARLRPLGHQQVAPEGRVALGQAVLGLHIGDQPAPGVDRLAAQQHLRPHDEVAIQQAPHTHQHDGAVRRDVADLVGRPRLGRHHPAGAWAGGSVALLQPHLPSATRQQRADAACLGLGRVAERSLGLVVKRFQALLADVLFVDLEVGEDLGRVAGNAQRGADDQKRQDQQEPPGAVHRVELDGAEQLGPERSELVDVVGRRFVLLEHRADDRGDADHRQQRNGEPHRRQQLDPGAQGLGAGLHAKALGVVGHGWERCLRSAKEKGRDHRCDGPALFGVVIGGRFRAARSIRPGHDKYQAINQRRPAM